MRRALLCGERPAGGGTMEDSMDEMSSAADEHVAFDAVPAEEQLFRMRHSAAHVLAEAVLEAFPEAKYAIGPPVENGFYYDFDLPRPLTPEDLVSLEAR